MKATAILATTTILTLTASAQACDLSQLGGKALQAALAVETVNGGGHPLTKELFPHRSDYSVYGVILSYSGRQSLWKVRFDLDSCRITSITKQ
jgi:hypothetical protein